MKIVTFLFFVLALNISSQNLAKVDQIVYSYPQINSFEELAKKIDYDFNSDIEKAKAAYTWLALNIQYYKEPSLLIKSPEYYVYTDAEDRQRREKRRYNKIALETFETRKGVCSGYAFSYQKLCDIIGIENEFVKGYVITKPNQIDYLATEKNHVWNAIKVNGEWIFLDVTFGSGYSLNGAWQPNLDNFYFNTNKNDLNKTHFPSDKKWLKILNQKPLKQFCEEPVFNKVFFLSNATLIYPKKGKILIADTKEIELKLSDLKSNTEIYYSYGTNQEAKKPTINKYDTFTEISIKKPKENSNLNIYFNNQLALQYKVVVK